VKLLAAGGLVVVVALAAVMFLSGGQHGPGLHAPSAGTGSQASPSAGSVAVVGVGEPADPGDKDRTIEITTLDAMAFEPATIEVAPGETVTFEVTNAGQAVHEFTLGDAAMQKQHADAMAHIPEGMAHDLPNSISMQPGERKALTWRFGSAGVLEYACHEPGHYDAGMRGELKVG
jgi:uncharacterized cupredoxin-like copper-binding protein